MEIKKLVIFTEAGAGIGYGHLMRCRSLADAFTGHGITAEVRLMLNEEEFPPAPGVSVVNWHQQPVVGGDAQYTLALIDSYRAQPECYGLIAAQAAFTCAIDDYNRIVYPCRLILNPGITMGKIDYSNQRAPVFEGKDFILLRKEIGGADRHKQVFHHTPQVITITTGGSDVHHLLARLGATVRAVLPSAEIRILFPDPAGAETLRNVLPDVNVLRRQSATGMLDLFQSSDLVITACGQTLHELAFLGTPFIGILTGEDQRFNQAYYFEENVINTLIRYDDSRLESLIGSELIRLSERKIREEMSHKMRGLVSENGAEHACVALLNAAGR